MPRAELVPEIVGAAGAPTRLPTGPIVPGVAPVPSPVLGDDEEGGVVVTAPLVPGAVVDVPRPVVGPVAGGAATLLGSVAVPLGVLLPGTE